MAFDQSKPLQNSALASAEVRNNFQHLKNAVSKEHNWQSDNPDATTHRLDQIQVINLSGSNQRDTYSGYDYITGSGDISGYCHHVVEGVPANTYNLQNLLQELVSRSHRHKVELRYWNCNCCNCGGG